MYGYDVRKYNITSFMDCNSRRCSYRVAGKSGMQVYLQILSLD